MDEKPKKKSTKLIVALVLAAIACVAAWVFMHRKTAQGQTAGTSDASAGGVRSVLHLESFVVNLADPDQTAFLRIGIDLGLQSPSTEKSNEKGSPLIPKIRDVILSVLTTWRSADLVASDGKSKLKDQLLGALRERVPELPVQEIYFTEFLVQR